ncbi:MAG: hypothetical protein U9P72_04370 [Campylobacterota bacterium]|nr:hypothetical protein [Campylobacterota bacterium]
MMQSINNIEFEGDGSRSVVVCNMFIRTDKENKILYASDIINTSDFKSIDFSSEGILKEINSHIAFKIEDKLGISVLDYGVEILNEEMVISYPELDLF